MPLGDLQSALKGTTLKVSREGDVLIVKHEQFVTRVEVSAPETAETVDAKISAIMTIRTEFPPELSGLLQMPGLIGVAYGLPQTRYPSIARNMLVKPRPAAQHIGRPTGRWALMKSVAA